MRYGKPTTTDILQTFVLQRQGLHADKVNSAPLDWLSEWEMKPVERLGEIPVYNTLIRTHQRTFTSNLCEPSHDSGNNSKTAPSMIINKSFHYGNNNNVV